MNNSLKLDKAQIEKLKEKYNNYRLYRLTNEDTGDDMVIRGSNWSEFEEITKLPAERIPFELIKTLVVYPEVNALDLETNKSGKWEPGRIVAVSEQIQRVLGYTKMYKVKNI